MAKTKIIYRPELMGRQSAEGFNKIWLNPGENHVETESWKEAKKKFSDLIQSRTEARVIEEVKPAQDSSKQNKETIEVEKPESTKKSPGRPKKNASTGE
jgi:hypothetical protein